MAYKYTITYLVGEMDNKVNPPRFLAKMFPDAEPTSISLSSESCEVIFNEKQTPVDFGSSVEVVEEQV